MFCKNAPQGSQENLLRRMGFEDLIELSKKFRFLLGSCPAWEAASSQTYLGFNAIARYSDPDVNLNTPSLAFTWQSMMVK